MPRFPPTQENTGSGSGTNTSTAAAGSTPAPGPSSFASRRQTRGDGDRASDRMMNVEVVLHQHGDSKVTLTDPQKRTVNDVLKKFARSMEKEPDDFMRNVDEVRVPSKLVEVMDRDKKKKVKAPLALKPEDHSKELGKFLDSDQEYGMMIISMKETFEHSKTKEQKIQSMKVLERAREQQEEKRIKEAEEKQLREAEQKKVNDELQRLMREITVTREIMGEKFKAEAEEREKRFKEEAKVREKAVRESKAEAREAKAKAREAEAKAEEAEAKAEEAEAQTKKLRGEFEQEKLRAERAEEKLKEVDESQQAELDDHKVFIISGSRTDTMAYARILVRHLITLVQARLALVTGLSDSTHNEHQSRVCWNNQFSEYKNIAERVAAAKKFLEFHIQHDQGLKQFLSTKSLSFIMDDQQLRNIANYDAHPGPVTKDNGQKYREIAAAIETILPKAPRNVVRPLPGYINACIDYLLSGPIPSNQST